MRLFGDVAKAVAQMGDPRFRRVLLTGLALTVALLAGALALTLGLLDWLVPEQLSLPWIGPVTWIDDVVSGASVLVLMLLSAFLMVPVASAFISLFLDDVTEAVEARHYPDLPQAARLPFLDGLRDGLNALLVLVVANVFAFAAYLALPPLAPFIFLALNGYLLSREYFQLIAARRLGRSGARAMRKRHVVRIWGAGIVMAVPLFIPILNLLVPILGAATFTHLYHRLPRPATSARTSRYP